MIWIMPCWWWVTAPSGDRWGPPSVLVASVPGNYSVGIRILLKNIFCFRLAITFKLWIGIRISNADPTVSRSAALSLHPRGVIPPILFCCAGLLAGEELLVDVLGQRRLRAHGAEGEQLRGGHQPHLRHP